MRTTIIILLSFLSLNAVGQEYYTTKSNIKYTVGDILQFGRPVIIAGGPTLGATSHWKTIYKKNGDLCNNSNLSNKKATIDKISELEGVTVLYFKLFKSTFYVKIDEALAKGEVVNENYNPNFKISEPDKYDKLKKLKVLFDSGAITKEEFESEKKKILNDI